MARDKRGRAPPTTTARGGAGGHGNNNRNNDDHDNDGGRAQLPATKAEGWWRFGHSAVVVGGCAVACFGNCATHGFVFDDQPAVLWNPDVHQNTSLAEVFSHDYWGEDIGSARSHGSYRPLTVLSFRLDHALWGLHAPSFHATNIALHALACVLVLRVCHELFAWDRWLPLVASLLFAVHPIHCEAVASVVGRADVLSCVFFLLALLAFFRALHQTPIAQCRPTRFSAPWVLVSVLLGASAMLCKETGITVVGVIAALDAVVVCDVVSVWLHGGGSSAQGARAWCSSLVWRVAVLAVCTGVVLWLRLGLMEAGQPVFSPQHNPAAASEDPLTRVLTLVYVACFNVWLLVFPATLCCDWSMGSIPLITSLWDARNLWSLAVVAALVVLARRALLSLSPSVRHVTGASLALALIPFLPASNLFFKVGFVVAERVLYVPSIGVCTLAAHQLLRAFPRSLPPLARAALVGAVVSALAARTVQRNRDWRDEEALFGSGVAANPLNAKLHYDYAHVLAAREDDAKDAVALRHYRLAIHDHAWEGYADPAFNLGNLLARKGDAEGARESWRHALRINPRHVKAMINIATSLGDEGDLEGEGAMLEQALRVKPDHPHALSNMGVWHMSNNRLDEAERMFRLSLASEPGFELATRRYRELLARKAKLADPDGGLDFIFVVPPDKRPGDEATVVAPDGQAVKITIPDYARPGHRLNLNIKNPRPKPKPKPNPTRGA